jgi:hypothetical protein
MFHFTITSEITNQLSIWYDPVAEGSAQRKASISTGQHNSERREYTFMP